MLAMIFTAPPYASQSKKDDGSGFQGTSIARTRGDQTGLNSTVVYAIATGFILLVERFDAAVFA